MPKPHETTSAYGTALLAGLPDVSSDSTAAYVEFNRDQGAIEEYFQTTTNSRKFSWDAAQIILTLRCMCEDLPAEQIALVLDKYTIDKKLAQPRVNVSTLRQYINKLKKWAQDVYFAHVKVMEAGGTTCTEKQNIAGDSAAEQTLETALRGRFKNSGIAENQILIKQLCMLGLQLCSAGKSKTKTPANVKAGKAKKQAERKEEKENHRDMMMAFAEGTSRPRDNRMEVLNASDDEEAPEMVVSTTRAPVFDLSVSEQSVPSVQVAEPAHPGTPRDQVRLKDDGDGQTSSSKKRILSSSSSKKKKQKSNVIEAQSELSELGSLYNRNKRENTSSALMMFLAQSEERRSKEQLAAEERHREFVQEMSRKEDMRLQIMMQMIMQRPGEERPGPKPAQ